MKYYTESKCILSYIIIFFLTFIQLVSGFLGSCIGHSLSLISRLIISVVRNQWRVQWRFKNKHMIGTNLLMKFCPRRCLYNFNLNINQSSKQPQEVGNTDLTIWWNEVDVLNNGLKRDNEVRKRLKVYVTLLNSS